MIKNKAGTPLCAAGRAGPQALGTGTEHRTSWIAPWAPFATCGVSAWNSLGLSFVSKALYVEKLSRSFYFRIWRFQDSILQKSWPSDKQCWTIWTEATGLRTASHPSWAKPGFYFFFMTPNRGHLELFGKACEQHRGTARFASGISFLQVLFLLLWGDTTSSPWGFRSQHGTQH